MEFIDLKTEYKKIEKDINKRINNVLTHSKFIMGPEIKELEKKLCGYTGAMNCITVSSGTDALILALMAVGVTEGDEVITTPFSFIAAAEAIAFLKAKPIFVDIDPDTYNMDPFLIKEAVTENTKAIIPVNLYGQCADLDRIEEAAAAYNLFLIEDAAQSFGATYKERKSCYTADIACTSFFPSKPLGCYGDGGACFTSDDNFAEILRSLRQHGQAERYVHPRIGMNARLDSIQAAVLLAKLEIFDEEVKLRERVGRRYTELLKNIPYIKTPRIEPFNTSVYAQYTIQVDKRDIIRQILADAGIPTAVHYPVPIHLQPIFKEQCKNVSFPAAEEAAKRVMSLPMHPFLSEQDQDTIVENLIKACEKAF